jgi:hypothetical protein
MDQDRDDGDAGHATGTYMPVSDPRLPGVRPPGRTPRGVTFDGVACSHETRRARAPAPGAPRRARSRSPRRASPRTQMLTARARRLVVVALIPISLSAASCDPLFEAQAKRMGVTVSEDGVPVIVAVPCPDERVVTMELLDPESVVEGRPTTYWRVRSDQAVVGKTYMLPIDNQPPKASIWLFDW